MKNHWIKRISIVLTALFLLAALPMLSMAEKDSGLRGKTATPSNLERAEEDDEVDDEADEPEEEPEEEIDGEEDGETIAETVDTVSDNVVVSEAKIEAKKEAETKAAAAAAPAPASVKITAEEISGTWKADEVTTYRFDKDGKGALILPKHKYAFTYIVEEGKLTLKFDNSRIGTKAFSAAVDGNQLTLARTGKEEFAPVTLEKAAD